MNTEILKIIEGGLARDQAKVLKFAILLSKNLKISGDNTLSKRIDNLLNKSNNRGYLTADSLSSVPVDMESRLSIVEVTNPTDEEHVLVFTSLTMKKIFNFIEGVKQREEMIKRGIDVYNSMLLYGPPGCGKTSAAQYISNSLGLPLVTARLDSMVSSLLGSTAKNIQKVFSYADNKPCVLFLDEFDAIAKARDDSQELGELKRVVNSLIQNIDNFAQNNILIAATNHHKLLDNAIWRRFSEIVYIGLPDAENREELLSIYLKGYPNNFIEDHKRKSIIINLLSEKSPSDIKNLCSNAIRNNLIKKESLLTYPEFIFAIMETNELLGFTLDDAVRFLSENGVTQKEIKEFLDLSLRQVGKILKV